MKQNKDKQIRELKRDRKYLLWWGFLVGVVVLIILSFAFIIVIGISSGIIEDLEQDLSECRDKVPIWTFEVICWDYMNLSRISFEGDYNIYEDYKEQVDYYKDIKECKVIG